MRKRRAKSPARSKGVLYGLLFGIPIGQIYVFTLGHGDSLFDSLAGLIVSLLFGVGFTLFFEYAVPFFRRLPFLLSVLSSGVSLALFVSSSIFGSVWLMTAVEHKIPVNHPGLARDMVNGLLLRPGFIVAVLVTMFGTLVVTFVTELSRKLGPGILTSWLLGKYREPRVENRIFLFLDLRDSTTLAEQLGHLQFSALVRDFFEDLTEPLTRTKGSVSHYIGDEAVLTWTLERGLLNGNCIHCFEQFRKALQLNREYYLSTYGVMPSFKGGGHCGEAVVTEVGQIKSEFVYHGDVLNTTARITGLCSQLEEDFLISGELAASLTPAQSFVLVEKGEHVLKGKAAPVGVVAVRFAKPETQPIAPPSTIEESSPERVEGRG